MQARPKWLLPVSVVVIVIVATGLLWWRTNAGTADGWWKHHGEAVLGFAAPPLLALLAWVCKQLISERPKRSTPEQLSAAQQALTARGLEWWRGVPEPAWPGQLLRAGVKPLDVTWSPISPGLSSAGNPPVGGSSGDVAGLVGQFRANYPCRLVIKGSAGSGKSVLARLMMAEMLKDPSPGSPVPVFLPLWSWSPGDERLTDWMKRQIAEAYPELQDVSAYGPTVVANLVDQGGVLPILDGLDALPRKSREKALADGELMSQDRLILTCRAGNFSAHGFIAIEPEEVQKPEAIQFLHEVTNLDDSCFSHLPDKITDPRLVYLISIVAGKDGADRKYFKDQADMAPAGSVLNGGHPAPEPTKEQLLAHLIPSLMPPGGKWAEQFPWYGDDPERWLSYLAGRDLRDPDECTVPFDRNDPGDSRIAWWNLYRAVPWLRDHQASFRAVIVSLLTFMLITLVFRNDTLVFRHDRSWTYSLFTAGAYALMVLTAGVFFGREPRRMAGPDWSKGQRFGVPLWWLRKKWPSWCPVVIAALTSCVLFGLLIGIRTGLSSGAADGFRTALWDGIVQGGMIIVLTRYIAGVPASPRTTESVDQGQVARYDFDTFLRAMVLGIAFGVLWGAAVVLRHQHAKVTPLGEDVTTGLVTGIAFTLDAWFFSWARSRFRARRWLDPESAASADIIGTVVCALVLGATFAFAFGINAPTHFNGMDVDAWFVVGAAMSVLGSEWLLYVAALFWLALRERKLPFRLMRFLECCRACGIVRVVGQEYQFHDDDLLKYLSGIPDGTPGPPARHLQRSIVRAASSE